MPTLRPTAAPVFGTLVILAAALVVRELLRAQLVDSGHAPVVAKNLSYLVVPVVLAVMMWPILNRHRVHLRYVYRCDALTLRIIVCGVLIGILVRVAWWSSLVAGISFGLVSDANAGDAIGPVFRFACPAPAIVALGLVVTAGLTPLVEETLHRGLILSALLHRGHVVAIVLSSLLFMLFHNTAAYAVAFLFGLLLALQYARTGAIWFPLATHATYNALIQLDWHCLNGRWHPGAEQLPLTGIGLLATLVLLLSAGLTCRLLKLATSGTPPATRM